MALRFRVALVAVALTAACVDTATTGVTTGSGYSIVPTIADSSTYPAGSVVIVRAGITSNGAILPSTSVGWSVIAGGGSVAQATTATDSLGIASVAWTLGDTAGINTLVIGIADRRDTLHVRGVIGAPSYLVAVGADSVGMAAGGTVTLQGKVTDRTGNAASGARVNWTASGGAISAASVVSDAAGIVAVTFTATTPGHYSVVAELPGLATHTYQILVH